MKQIPKDLYPDIITPEYLARGSLFGAISSDCVSFIIDEARLLSLDVGDKVFDCGQRGEAFFVVVDGELRFFKNHLGNLLHTRDISFGEETGFVAMIALHDHVGFAQASEPSLVLEISADLFARLQQSYPTDFGIITLNLARDMARTIRKLNNALIDKTIEFEA